VCSYLILLLEVQQKSRYATNVIPAEAGIQTLSDLLDSGSRVLAPARPE